MYRVAVKEFFAGADGTVKYLVLSREMHFWMKMEETAPQSSAPDEWMKVGETGKTERNVPRPAEADISRSLLLEGWDISNVRFGRRRIHGEFRRRY